MDIQKTQIRKPKCALLIDQWLPWHSAELEVVMHLAFSLEEHGYAVDILTPSWTVQAAKPFVVRRFLSSSFLALYLMFRGNSYEFVHAHGPYSTWALLWSRFFYQTPTITTAYAGPLFHQGWRFKKAWFKDLYLRHQYDAQVSVSESFLDLKNVNQSVEVIPFGVDTEPFDEVRVEKGDRFNALYVGSLRPGKGLEMLLKAVSKLIENQGFIESHKDFMLHLVGTGPSASALKHRAEELGISKYLRFHGDVRHATLIQLYKTADLFVRPCSSDSLSLTLLEACAAGLPLLVSNVGDHRRMVIENVNGHLIEPGHLEEWVFYMERFVTTPHLLEKMGEQSRALVEDEFDWEVCIQKHLALYERIRKKDLKLQEPKCSWVERGLLKLSSLQLSRPYTGKKPLKLVFALYLQDSPSEDFMNHYQEWCNTLEIPVKKAWRLSDDTLKDAPALKRRLRSWDKEEKTSALPFPNETLSKAFKEEGFELLETGLDPVPNWQGTKARFTLDTFLEPLELLLPRIHRFRRYHGAEAPLVIELSPYDFDSKSHYPNGSGENFTKLAKQLSLLGEEINLKLN